MGKFGVVLRHTFLTNLKRKSFIWTTVILSAFIIILINLSTILQYFSGEEGALQLEIYDPNQQIYPLLTEQLTVMYPEQFQLALLPWEGGAEAEGVETADRIGMERVKAGEIDGYLLVEGEAGNYTVSYKEDETIPGEHVHSLQQALNAVQLQIMTSQLNLTAEQAGRLFEPMPFQFISVAVNAMSKEEFIQSFALVYILIFAIYFSVLMYGQKVAMEVAAEKTSRVMEILISSLSPVKQLFAKILGIAMLGLFQTAVLLGVGALAMKFSGQEFSFGEFQFNFSEIKLSLILYAVLFYLLGYLLYATLLAMVGSLVSRTEDTAQLMTPIMMLFVVGFIAAMYGINHAESGLVRVMSYIPFFSPMLMFLRIGMGAPTGMEIVNSIALLVVFIIFFGWIGGKVYRGGVLMYGKRPSFKDIGQAMKLR